MLNQHLSILLLYKILKGADAFFRFWNAVINLWHNLIFPILPKMVSVTSEDYGPG
ncbi:hypothetical protein LCGC14_2644270, partial [marine sediment metagenome]